MKHLIAIALLFSAACHKDQSATGAAAKEAMGLYANGFNLILKDPRGMIDTYFQTIPKTGPDVTATTGAAKPHLFPAQQMAASSIKEARESFVKAKGVAPEAMSALGPESDQIMTATDKLVTTYTAAVTYYEAETYKDDKFARGKQLHADMLAVAKELDEAIAKMEDGLSSIEDAQSVEAIKDHEGKKDYGYWYRSFNLSAKKFLVASERDPKKSADAFKALDAVHAELAKFVADKGHDVAQSFVGYMTTSESFYAAATKVVRAVAENGKLADADQALVNAYNNLVNLGNSLGNVEAAGGLK